MAYGMFRRMGHVMLRVDDRNQHPDDASGQHHGLGLAQMCELFRDDEGVGRHEQDDGGNSDPMRCEIHGYIAPAQTDWATYQWATVPLLPVSCECTVGFA